MKRPLTQAFRTLLCLSLLFSAMQGQAQQILDQLSASPTVAYSLRQLKSTATRSIQVRRSSDNLTQDIGFTAGGDLDQAALLSFTGVGNGYVTIWYDQSGNGHDATQATLAKQPRIVNTGVVDVQNGRPICDFNGTTQTMATAAFPLTTPLSLFLVHRRTGVGTASNGYVTIFDGLTNNTFDVDYANTANPTTMGLFPMDWGNATVLAPVTQLSSNTLFLYSALTDASSGVQYVNGGTSTHTFGGASTSLGGIRLFRGDPLPADNDIPAGQLSEVVVYNSKISTADWQMLECSEGIYYSITLAPAGLDVSISGNPVSTACSQVKEEVSWKTTDLVNVQASGSNLNKYQSNNSWNGGAASWNTVSDNGYFQFTATETSTYRMAGLSTANIDASYTSIQYAFYLVSGGSLQIYESGSSRGGFGTYTTGDILRISVESGVVKYYKNGTLLYISGVTPTLPMLVDVSIYNTGGTFGNPLVSNYNAGSFTATAVNAGTNPVYQWMLNGSPVGTNSTTYTNPSLANNDVVGCVVTPDIAGCGTIPVVSNNIIQGFVPPVNLDFSIQGSAAISNCATVIEQVRWKLSDLTANMLLVGANDLSKFQSGAWDGGAASWNTVSDNGYFQFTASETTKSRMAGLSATNANASYTSIQYAFYLVNGGTLQIYESGSYRGSFGTYATGDLLKIAVESGVVRYYKNGVLLYFSNTAPVLPLLVDVSINSAGGTITSPLVSNYNAGTFTANVLNAGASPSYQWLLNGSPVGTNSNVYSNGSLTNGDVVSCVVLPNLPGCNNLPLPSNTLTYTVVQPLNVDFSIQGVPATANCNAVVEQVKWQLSDLATNMTVNGVNGLSKFQGNGWDGGAASWNTVSNNGYFQFTANETNKSKMAGLSTTYTSPSYTTIQYAFYLVNNGVLQVYESGSGRATVGTYATGDILRIAVESNVVKYYKNGTLLYVSTVAPTLPLLVDVSMNDQGSSLSNALVSNLSGGSFIANALNAGVSPTYQWMLNGSPVGTNSNTYSNPSLANSDVVSCILTPNLSGCTSLPVNSNTITDTVQAPLGLDFSIQGVAVASNCVSVLEQVKWKLSDLTPNMTLVAPNSLSKFQGGAWDGGAASWNTVSDNGYFQFTATETNKSRMAGLSTTNVNANYNTIQYAFFLVNGGALQIYENGGGRGGFGTYATGDVLKIAVESGLVKYYKNGTLLYISANAPTLPLLVDVSIADVGGTVTNAVVSNYNGGSFTATAVNAGVNPVYQWMLNGSPVGTNSTVYTNAGLAGGDVVSCVLTPDLTGCMVTPVNSNIITDTVVAPLGLDFSIQGSAVSTGCTAVIEQVKWQLANLSGNMTIAGTNSLLKFQGGAWDGGAASWNTVSNNGYFQFTATETNKSRMAGLSTNYASSSFNTIQYAFYLVNNGTLGIYESGSSRGNFGTYATGDIFKIAVESNVVKYYKNGALVYVSGLAPVLPLLVDVSIATAGGTVTNALVYNLNAGTFTANAVNAGASPTYQWLLNGSPVGTNSNTYTNPSLANHDVVSCVLTPNLGGCGSIPVNSNTLTDSVVSPLGLDFSIQGVAAISSCNAVIEQVEWKLSSLASNVTIAGTNNLSKFQGTAWDGGAASWNTVSNNGYFQFTATETNRYRMAGLSTNDINTSYTTIQYAFYLVNNGTLQIYENGGNRGNFGTYATGDVFRIAVESNVIKYYKNGTLLYVSVTAPVLPLLADVSLYDAGATITNAVVSNYNAGSFIANAVNAGVNPVYQWLLNGNPVGTNSNAYTNAALGNNDAVSCVLTPDFSGCVVTNLHSNTIRDTTVAPLNADLALLGQVSATGCTAETEQVKWKLSNLASNMSIVGINSLSKFQGNGWDGGAASWNTVSNNGYFQFTASETTTSRMAGLSTNYTGSSYTTIQYAFYLVAGGALQIYESGSGRGGYGTYTPGDILKIAVEFNVVKYYRNGVLLYTSGVAPTLPLLVDVSVNSAGGTITNAWVTNTNAGSFVAATVNAGSPANYQWSLNGGVVQSGTNPSYSNPALNNKDMVTLIMTPNLAGCTAGYYVADTAIFITAGNTTTWTGATSSNWYTASNWTNGYPDRYTSATIPAGTPNNPAMATDGSVYDLTIDAGATLTVIGSPQLFVYRNLTTNGSFVAGTGTVDFVSCSGAGVINSSGPETFYNMVINSPFGVTMASGTQQIANKATFTAGLVQQHTTLTFLNGSSVTGVSDASHVVGPVNKVGNSAFTFPVGDNTYYRPISISNPGSVTDMFTAQYYFAPTNPTYGTAYHDITISQLSDKEYWSLNRAIGVSNVTVTLSWNLRSGTITSLGAMTVGGWDPALSKWRDRGNGGNTGNSNAGTVKSSAAVGVFNVFTLASLTTNNVLPVQLLYFHGEQVNRTLNHLSWSTASEQHSDAFIVERSADGRNFDPLGRVKAAGNSDQPLHYSLDDLHPLNGKTFYRLQLVDLDGSAVYSEIVAIDNEGGSGLVVYPNPTRNSLFIDLRSLHALRVSIVDNTGREVLSPMVGNSSTIAVDVSMLTTGLYIVLIDLEDKTRVARKIRIQK